MTFGNAAATIVVRIVGDSKQLSAAVGNANRTLGGLGGTSALKGVAVGAAIGVATAAVVDLGQTALTEGDRVGDALTRLETQLDRDLVASIDKASDKMTDLGQSRQDVLELAASFTDIATEAGIADESIADIAPDVAEVAAAMALISDTDAATTVADIGKAADGNDRALRNLGVYLSDAEVEARALRDSGKALPGQLTDTELATARLNIVMEKLAPRLEAVKDGAGDVEQSTATLQAKWETLMGKIGEGIDGPLNDFLTWTLNGVSGLEDFIGLLEKSPKFLDHFGDVVENLTRGPLGSLLDTLHGILGAIGVINDTPVTVRYSSSPNPDRNSSSSSAEAQIVASLNDYANRNGLTIL